MLLVYHPARGQAIRSAGRGGPARRIVRPSGDPGAFVDVLDERDEPVALEGQRQVGEDRAVHRGRERRLRPARRVIEKTRAATGDLPAGAALSFQDGLRDYQAAAALARREGAADDAEQALALPGIIDTGAAEALVADWLRRAWQGREAISLAVPAATSVHGSAPSSASPGVPTSSL